MDAPEVEALVDTAVSRLLRNDGGLLIRDVAERAITNRLAYYLSELFEEWNVDCEYNRNIDTIKRLKYAIEPGGELRDRAVFPDIIVHKRGTTENLLVVEVKKSTNPQPDDFDLRKLGAFREQLGYLNAVFYRFRTGAEPAEVLRQEWV